MSAICRHAVINTKSKLSSILVARRYTINSCGSKPFLGFKNILYFSRRTFFFKRSTPEQFKIKDNIPDQYIMIYKNRLDKYILGISYLVTLSAIVVSLVLVMEENKKTPGKLYFDLAKLHPKSNRDDYLFYIVAFVLLAVVSHITIQKLPMRIYYLAQQKKYIYIFHSPVPTVTKRVTCKIGEVFKQPVKGILPWKEDAYKLKTKHDQRNIILVENFFRRPGDLHVMLGIQSDPDADVLEKK